MYWAVNSLYSCISVGMSISIRPLLNFLELTDLIHTVNEPRFVADSGKLEFGIQVPASFAQKTESRVESLP